MFGFSDYEFHEIKTIKGSNKYWLIQTNSKFEDVILTNKACYKMLEGILKKKIKLMLFQELIPFPKIKLFKN